GDLGLLGMHLEGYGCPGRSAVEYGIAALELEAGDSGLRTFVSVQGSLAMSAIHRFGSEEQKNRYLPGMAAGELIGCFGLTEPTAGSDPGAMAAPAVRSSDGSWVLNGARRRIGLASIADVAVRSAATAPGPIPGRRPPPPSEAPTAVGSSTAPSGGSDWPRSPMSPSSGPPPRTASAASSSPPTPPASRPLPSRRSCRCARPSSAISPWM